MKSVNKLILTSSLTAFLVISIFAFLSFDRFYTAEVKEANANLEKCMQTAWEFLMQKGGDFRIDGGKLLAGRYVLNGNFEVPDKVQKIFGGVSTVFMGDTRVSTNVLRGDGSRAVGTRLVGPAYDAIFKEGKAYRGEALILGIPYLTAYDPIRDSRGKTVGVLFAGMKKSVFLAHTNELKMQLILLQLCLMAVFATLMVLLGRVPKKLEKENENHLLFLQTLIDTMPNPVFYKDTQGKYLGCNKAFETSIGLAREKIVGSTVFDIAPPQLAASYHKADLELSGTKDTQIYESSVKYADGMHRDVIFFKAAFPAFDGTAGGMIGTFLDISERKRAEFEIETQKKFAISLVQNSTAPTFVLDREHRVIIWNRACEELTGVKAADVLGTDEQWKAFYDHKKPLLADFVINRNEAGNTVHYDTSTKSTLITEGLQAERWISDLRGRQHYILFNAAPLRNTQGELIASIETIEDITEHKLSEKKLLQTLSLLSATLESTADGILVRDLDKNVVAHNGKFAEMWGIPQVVLATKDDRKLRLFVLDQLKDPKNFLELTENLYVHPEIETADILELKDGRIFERVSKPQVVDNEIVGRVISFRNITGQKKAETELRESAELYRSLVENIDLGITLIDNSYRIIMANSASGKMFAKPVGEILQKECFREFEKSTEKCPHCPGATAMETGKPETVQVEGVRDDGSSFVAKLRAFPVFDSNGKATRFIEVVQDITDQIQSDNDKRNLEEQLRQSQKFEAIGTLTGGIAHDFNNFLTVITAYCTLIERKTEKEDPLRNYLVKIFAATEKAALLTQSLLAYSRKQAIATRPVDLKDIIRKSQSLLARLLMEDIELTVRTAAESLTIMADSLQIEQVLMNLATNARDAMPGGGILQISTELMEMGADFVKSHGYGVPGKYALLAVSDTGKGMDAKTRERIFEPFFTTKEVGKGTGLGLSMALGIIKQHNGFLNVYSEPDKGTTFRIYLPLTDSDQTVSTQGEIPRHEGGNETILLVEDDNAIRASLKELLEEEGYTIIEAVDGDDGIEKFEEHKNKVQLLLLDVIMPKKNGKEVYESICLMRPGIKAVYLSGYTADILTAKGILQGNVNLISKPVTINALSAKIREVLDT